MPRLSAEKINEIRQSVDIVDVIGNYLSLQKKGRNYVSLCPFHDDSHPSMSISPERQIYMCFVCHNGGNVFTFLKNYLKIPYIEAVKMVASMGNIDISEYNLEKRVQPVEQKSAEWSHHPKNNSPHCAAHSGAEEFSYPDFFLLTD